MRGMQYTGCTISNTKKNCFDLLTSDEKKLLDEHSVVMDYDKKEMICKQGSLVSYIMFIETGLVKIYISNYKNSLVLKILPEHNFIGLAAASEEHSTYPYSAKTYIKSRIRQIDVDVFRQLLLSNPAFSKEIINILSNNSVQIYGRFFCITHKQSYGRIADILLCLSERVFKTNEFELPLSRKDLAELTGMSAENVIRILKKLNDDNVIATNGKNIIISDIQNLRRISETG